MAIRLPDTIVRFATSPRELLIWAAGGVCALAAMGIGALVIVEGGLFDATASTPHIPAVAVTAHTAFIRSVQVSASRVAAPTRFTPAEVLAGFRDYDASCAVCHGAPGISQARWVSAMIPAPPYLEDSAHRWRTRELYWIVGQGAKMTAMPAWAEVRSSGQVWDLVAFLEALPYLTASDYARMRANTGAGGTPNALPAAAPSGHPRPTP